MDIKIIIQLLHVAAPIIFIGLLLAFAILGIVLNYHWTRYGIMVESVKRVRGRYFGVSLVLFIVMAIGFVSILW